MNCYLGIDIGSISTKGVVIDDNNEIIASSLEPGSSITYNLRFWLTENAPNTVLGSSMVKKIKLKTEYIPENN